MQKIVNRFKILSAIGFTTGITYASRALADFGPFETDFGTMLKRIFTFVFGAAGVVFVVLFLVGGVQYLTSAGNEEASTKAKKLLLDAVIGLVIVLVSYAAASWILRGLGGTIDAVLQ